MLEFFVLYFLRLAQLVLSIPILLEVAGGEPLLSTILQKSPDF